ncbi:MAG: efflux RND transporter periplasmic adaptor subunit [Gammaproteobacteria bacterium]
MKTALTTFYSTLLLCSTLLATAQVTAQATVPVQVATVELRSVSEQIGVSGTVTSPRTATLSTAVAGQVVGILVDEGRLVAKDETVLNLDAELAELALERSRLEVRQRQTVLADARRRFDEASSVGPGRGIARSQIDSLRAEVVNVEASLAVLKVDVRAQAALVKRHKITAPFSGVIRQRFSELGEWVSPGDGLFELVAMDGLRFDFSVSQNVFGRIKTGALLDIRLESLPGQTLQGRVEAIVPIRDAGSRTFTVRAVLVENDSLRARVISPGMSTSANISLDTGKAGPAVSRDAVLRFADGRTVAWVVETLDGVSTVRMQAVQLGLEFDEFAEVVEGLKAGDRVVIRGNESLQEGQAVAVTESGR